MGKESILYGVVGLLAGIIIASFGATYAVNNNYQNMMRMMGMRTNAANQGTMNEADMSMSDMANSLKNKTGDNFDKAFISGMVAHHQGAIGMANLARQNAKHDEIKNLANDIVSAQTKEIIEMKSWQVQWGYAASSTGGTGHDMNQMMGY